MNGPEGLAASLAADAPRGAIDPLARPRRLILTAVVFACTLAVSAGSLTTHRQLGYMRGLADRWLALGINLAAHGVFGNGTEPTVFKPPGYPAFLWAVLRSSLGAPSRAASLSQFPLASDLAGLTLPYEAAYLERAARAVYWSNAVLLAAAAGLMFVWLSEWLPPARALVAALVFGLNPYSVILVGMLHYSVLHLLAVIAGCYLLHRALQGEDGRPRAWLAAGAVWGVATLIRPVTLILPPFVLLALLLRDGSRFGRSLRAAAVFTAGMALAIAPWTARNHAVSGRFIPVNAQTWMSLWAPTVRPVEIQPNHYRWKALRDRLMPLLKRLPAEGLRTDPESVADNLTMESELRDVVLRNLRRRPGVYAQNALRSFVTFNLHINSVVVKVFQRLQVPGAEIKDWYWPGDPQDFHPPHASRAFAAFFALLTALGAGGLLLAVRHRDQAVLAPAAVYACLLLAHSITWMDLMYYYVKLPLVWAFAFFFVDRAHHWTLARVAGRSWSVGAALAVLLAASGLGLAVWVLV